MDGDLSDLATGIARFTNDYHAIAHVPTLIVFMVWLFVRHRDHHPRWRNGLVVLTGASLFIRFVPVAPPRFIDEIGFVGLSQRHGFDVYGPAGSAVSDQFAAMPRWADGIAAVALLLVGLRLDTLVRRRAANGTSLRKITEPTGSVSLAPSLDTVLPEQPIVQGRPSSTAREHP